MILHVLLFMLLNISGAQHVSRVSVQQGKSIIIPCWYNQNYRHNVKYLSVGNYLASSKYVVSSDDQSKHKSVSISDHKTLFTLELRSVLTDQIGRYWCGIEIHGRDHGESFYLQVTPGISGLYVENQMLMGFETGSVAISCHYHNPRKRDEMWCKLNGQCVKRESGLLDGAFVEMRFSSGIMTVTMSKLKKQNTGWYLCHVKELQMPVHITVFTRRETTVETTTTEMTSTQSTSSSTVQYLGAFTSPQTSSQIETPAFSWIIITFVLIVILSCTAGILCKKKQNRRKQQSNTDNEETHFRACERQPTQISQAVPEDYELIYTTVLFKEH